MRTNETCAASNKNIIFSSSATVYGNPAEVPITEACPKGRCTNPYGQTKSMLEEILIDMHTADVENAIIPAASMAASWIFFILFSPFRASGSTPG